MTGDLHHLTIAEGVRLIGQGKLSPVKWTERLLERIEAIDPLLDSFITVTGGRARSQARRADEEIRQGRCRGPLHGVPFALKDVIDTAGVRTTAASKVSAGRVPGRDAAVLRRLEAAGAILLGKLTTHEFAQGGPSFDLPWPPARNPWDRRRFTGSTSSGAGAAVAAGLTPAALGTDQGGSVRHPAAHCGLVGLKPTNGLVSRMGAIPNSFSFDCLGPMTWTVEDCAIVLQAIAGHDPDDPGSADVTIPDYRAALRGDVKGMKVGLVRHFHDSDLDTDAEVKSGVERAADVLGDLGAEVRDVRLPPLADFCACQWTITCAELNAVHEENLRHRLADFGENTRYRLVPGAMIGAVDYVQAQRLRRDLIRRINAVFEDVDVMLTATVPVLAPLIEEMKLSSIFSSRGGMNMAFSVGGGPAVAICCGFSEAGLPLSAQIAGRPFDDAAVLKLAHAYEQATPWRDRRPPVETHEQVEGAKVSHG
ncbi:MAG: amidase [Rhodospirillales bacterium]|nr:amidase [Rhodospirillales bacterium]